MLKYRSCCNKSLLFNLYVLDSTDNLGVQFVDWAHRGRSETWLSGVGDLVPKSCLNAVTHGLSQTLRLLCLWDFPEAEYWSGLRFPFSEIFHSPGIEQHVWIWQVVLFPTDYTGRPWVSETHKIPVLVGEAVQSAGKTDRQKIKMNMCQYTMFWGRKRTSRVSFGCL